MANNFWTENFKWFLILGVVILAFLMWKGCGNDKEEKALADLARLQIEKDSVMKEKTKIVNQYNNDVLQLASERDSVQLIADYRLNQLKTVKPHVIKIAGEIITKMDSAKCLELAKIQEDLLWLIDDYANQQTLTQMYTDSVEIGLRGIIVAKDDQIAVLEKTLDFATNQVIPAIKKRTEVYVGGDVIGNRTTVFSGYGANINLLSKKGQMYSVGASWINGEAFYSAGVKVRLSFKKH